VPQQVPVNKKLWEMVIIQAKARFATYPSPGASAWVHKQYVEHGGKFVESSAETKKRKELIRRYQAAKKEQLAHAKSDDKKKK